jgi:DNA repair photolyase
MTFDQYSRCAFDCVYCFSRYQKAVGVAKEQFFDESIKGANVERIKCFFRGEYTSAYYDQFVPLVQERKVMQWGGLADPFCPYEKEHGLGLRLLRFFAEIDYPICFSTKSTWWTKDPRYVELFQGRKNWNVKVSIITLDQRLASCVERRVPSPQERLKAIERIASWGGGGATLRLRPFMIGVSNPTHKQLIVQAGRAGATALSTEFFCLEQRSVVLREDLLRISHLVGFDIFQFYKKFSRTKGYMRLSRAVKRKYVDEMEAACRVAGMRFYVSDAHFKERCDNGSCCGLTADWNYCRGQWCEALQIAKKTGQVSWADMAPHLQYAKRWLWRLSSGFNTNGAEVRAKFYEDTMYDYLRKVWNNPEDGQSPYKMYEGIVKPIAKDKNGDLVYAYCPEKA